MIKNCELLLTVNAQNVTAMTNVTTTVTCRLNGILYFIATLNHRIRTLCRTTTFNTITPQLHTYVYTGIIYTCIYISYITTHIDPVLWQFLELPSFFIQLTERTQLNSAGIEPGATVSWIGSSSI